MGGLSSVINKGVQTAKKVTESLQVTITLERFVEDEKVFTQTAGRRLYDGIKTEHKVVIQHRTRYVGVEDVVQGVQVSSVQFLEPIMITTRDRITLPDGTKPQIVAVEGALGPDGLYYAPRVVF